MDEIDPDVHSRDPPGISLASKLAEYPEKFIALPDEFAQVTLRIKESPCVIL
jgi:hypothetical protein